MALLPSFFLTGDANGFGKRCRSGVRRPDAMWDVVGRGFEGEKGLGLAAAGIASPRSSTALECLIIPLDAPVEAGAGGLPTSPVWPAAFDKALKRLYFSVRPGISLISLGVGFRPCWA